MALFLTACTAHVGSTLKVDGAAYTPTTCVSGQARAFPGGIELSDPVGRRLRLVANVDGSTTVVYFDAAAPIGQVLGVCASMNVTPGTGVINGVRNQEGGATLACVTPWRRIEGNVTFENCH